jgi:AraC family transcriptional regulator
MDAMATAGHATADGHGNFVTWQRGRIVIGCGRVIPAHAQYSIQVAVGSGHGIRFKRSDDASWTEYEGAIIASRQPHAMDVTRVAHCAVLFVEPETREGRALRERYRLDDPAQRIAAVSAETIAPLRDALFAAWSGQAHLGGRDRRRRGGRAGADGRHRTLRWRRFLRVWELVPQGVSLSAAAHAAGFADAAHRTRTSHRMFGFAPSAMHLSAPLRKSAPTYK